MKSSICSILALSSAVSAWMPHERNMFGEQPNSVARNIAAGKGRTVKRFDSSYNKIRGVNMGSHFIMEPWMASQEWSSMGCGSTKSEFDCVSLLGQEAANAAFQKHWSSWITQQDIKDIKAAGLNTIRVPVGYWIIEGLVYTNSEHFPQGGLAHLDNLAGWAAAENIYMILDLHGAPGAQDAQQPFTGQYAPTPGFFQDYQYERAYEFLGNMTQRIHQNANYKTCGMIEVLNEPDRASHPTLLSEYYPNAFKKIRATEASLNIPADQQLTVQFMDQAWGDGNPKDAVQGQSGVAYDDHRYLKYANIAADKNTYIQTSCTDTFGAGGDTPTIVGEWSISPASSVEGTADWDPSTNQAFYKQWWAAQVSTYEKNAAGWIFWAWKSQLGNDYRWSYQQALAAKVFEDPSQAASLAKCP